MSIKPLLIPLIFSTGLLACKNGDTENQAESHQAPFAVYNPTDKFSGLNWVATADAKTDAQLALQSGSKKLWAYHSRAGIQIPGVAPQNVNQVTNQYDLSIAQGMSDVVYSDDHLKLRTLFEDYARTYNTIILDAK